MPNQLTKTQQTAALMIAHGCTIEETADKLQISLLEMYHWLKIPDFEAYQNRQMIAARTFFRQGVTLMTGKAIKVLLRGLESENEAIALRSAKYVVDCLSKMQIGQTDVQEVVRERRERASEEAEGMEFPEFEVQPWRDEERYKLHCEKYGVTPYDTPDESADEE